jgi:pilus assembly protein CpaF
MAPYLEHPALESLRPLLVDPEITEIMINGPSQVYVERRGVLQPDPLVFEDPRQLELVMSALLQFSGRSVTASAPYIDFRLPDGSRGNVIIPPLALNGPTITIRKFTKTVTTTSDLLKMRTMSKRMAQLMAAAVRGKANIIFSGATGTGKTTTLSILSRYIPESERIITIEDTAELQLHQKHVVRLECRGANIEGKGAITLAHLVRNALRMRPTRIIVGEIRGDEAVDMLQSISSGHQGCLAVLHASTPLDAVSRLELMSLSRGLLLPLWAIHRQIAGAIDIIVQHDFTSDGTRKISRITEVAGVEGDHVVLRDLFEYQRLRTDPAGREVGQWVSGGGKPRFLTKCEKMGFTLPPEVYAAGIDDESGTTTAPAGPAQDLV